jgi:hypothetical protein
MHKMAQITEHTYAPITLKSKTGGMEPAVPQMITPGDPTPQVTPDADTTPMGVTFGQIPN